jgi:hypothetical protein
MEIHVTPAKLQQFTAAASSIHVALNVTNGCAETVQAQKY